MFQSVSIISLYSPIVSMFWNTRNGVWYFHLFQSLISICFETFRNSWNVQTLLIFITFQSVSKWVKQFNLVNFQRFIFLYMFHWNKMHTLGLCVWGGWWGWLGGGDVLALFGVHLFISSCLARAFACSHTWSMEVDKGYDQKSDI